MSEPFLFVSHVSEDRAPASELVAELERRDIRCWIAPRDVRPGKPYDDEIAEAIDDCTAMLLLFSEHCNASEYIRREITVAGEARKLIIPYRIEDAQPKRGLRVRLADLHWIDGFVARESAIDALVKATNAGRPRPAGEDGRDAAGAYASVSSSGAAAASVSASPSSEPGPSIESLIAQAERGIASAQFLLGMRYADGKNVPVDEAAAVRWFGKAAEQGDIRSQYRLGEMHEAGRGVAANLEEALRWFRLCAEHGDRFAQHKLGAMHEAGSGIPQSRQLALDWYRQAAGQGHETAQAAVARLTAAGTRAVKPG